MPGYVAAPRRSRRCPSARSASVLCASRAMSSLRGRGAAWLGTCGPGRQRGACAQKRAQVRLMRRVPPPRRVHTRSRTGAQCLRPRTTRATTHRVRDLPPRRRFASRFFRARFARARSPCSRIAQPTGARSPRPWPGRAARPPPAPINTRPYAWRSRPPLLLLRGVRDAARRVDSAVEVWPRRLVSMAAMPRQHGRDTAGGHVAYGQCGRDRAFLLCTQRGGGGFV